MKSLLHDAAGGGTLRYYLIASRYLTNDFSPLNDATWNERRRKGNFVLLACFVTTHVWRIGIGNSFLFNTKWSSFFQFKIGDNFEFSISSNDNYQYYKRVKISNQLIGIFKTCASVSHLTNYFVRRMTRTALERKIITTRDMTIENCKWDRFNFGRMFN